MRAQVSERVARTTDDLLRHLWSVARDAKAFNLPQMAPRCGLLNWWGGTWSRFAQGVGMERWMGLSQLVRKGVPAHEGGAV